MPKPPKPPSQVTSEEPDETTPAPVTTDSAGVTVGDTTPSAGERTPAVTDDVLRKRVEDTEAWVARLREAQAEGHRLSGEPRRGTRETRESADPDTAQALERLRAGDDQGFVSALFDATTRRVARDIATSQTRHTTAKSLVERITGIVEETAPDVPPKLFWSFADEVEAAAPGDLKRQIEMGIELSREELKSHKTKQDSRRAANRENRESAESPELSSGEPTLTETPRKGGKFPEGSLAADIREIQKARRGY